MKAMRTAKMPQDRNPRSNFLAMVMRKSRAMVLFMGDFFFYDFKVYLQNPLFLLPFSLSPLNNRSQASLCEGFRIPFGIGLCHLLPYC